MVKAVVCNPLPCTFLHCASFYTGFWALSICCASVCFVAVGVVCCGFAGLWHGLSNSGMPLASEVWHVAIGVAADFGQKNLGAGEMKDSLIDDLLYAEWLRNTDIVRNHAVRLVGLVAYREAQCKLARVPLDFLCLARTPWRKL